MPRRRVLALGAAAFVVLGGVAGAVVAARSSGDGTAREREVAARGAEVMRFDLERTTHVFEKRAGGGVQVVVADDVDDTAEIRKVRDHLRAEAKAFASGDFGAPAEIHGMDMPGLETLRASADRMTVRYADVASGGRIRYESDDADVVRALHAWFDAQVSDHGRHATELDLEGR